MGISEHDQHQGYVSHTGKRQGQGQDGSRLMLEPVEFGLAVFDTDTTLKVRNPHSATADWIDTRHTNVAVSPRIQPTMSRMNPTQGWPPIRTAPRDGTPVILWVTEDETPPEISEPVGYWTVNPKVGVGYWRLFGDPPRFRSDGQLRGWRPLLRER